MEGIPPRRKDERDYEKEMREEYLRPLLTELGKAVAEAGDSNAAWLAAVGGVVAKWESGVLGRDVPREIVERWARKVKKHHTNRFVRQMARNFKIDLRPFMNDTAVDEAITKAINANIDLIVTIPKRFHETLKEKFLIGERLAPMDQKTRERMFARTGKSSGYNLRRIVRDQTNKLNGQVAEIRQTEAGIERYKWSTSEDDRVRPTHVSKSEQIFEWTNPPPDTGHPGHDIQCRCVAIPQVTIAELHKRFGQ